MSPVLQGLTTLDAQPVVLESEFVAEGAEREDVIISEELANPNYHTYSKQALPRFMGYGDHEYQSQIERRIILERAYKANFPTDHLSDGNLIIHIEDYGPPESEQRFRRICSYLHGRGSSLIEANVQKRVDENHRSFRQVHQTFEDGMWFVRTFGRNFGYIGFGRLISETPKTNLWSGHPVDIPIEPLLVFCLEELPTNHSPFLPEDNLPSSGSEFCKGAWVIGFVGIAIAKEENTMLEDKIGDVKCSSCGMDYYADTADITQQKYRNHAHLIRRRFETRDFVSEEEFDREWTRQRGRLDPEAEVAIARAYLSDHIAPMRADTDEMAGIPGDSIKRYGLDRIAISPDASITPIYEKSRWPHEVKRGLSNILIRVDRKNWEGSTEEERIALLRESGAHTMKRFKDIARDDLGLKLPFKSEWEFDELIKHVRGEMKLEDSAFAIAGHGRGVRYAMFSECFECNTVGVEFGDGHNCTCSKCMGQFIGVRCERPECLLNRSGMTI